MTILAYVLAAGLISLLVNLVLIRRAEDIGLIKLPDHRSSHEKPTATGGGMGICIGVLLVSPLFALSSPLIIAALVLATVLLLGLSSSFGFIKNGCSKCFKIRYKTNYH